MDILTDEERQPCEVWKDIKGYEGLYQVSNLGRVKSLARKHILRIWGKDCLRKQPERILKQWKRSSYLLVDLWKDGKRDVQSVHHLVFNTFNGENVGDFFIHHKDENKFNNNLDNLELMSVLEHNRLHHGGKPSWNKGLKMPPEIFTKMWETRRRNLQYGQ